MNSGAMEQALRDRIDTLEAVLSSICDGLLMLDRDCRYSYFSEAGARIWRAGGALASALNRYA